MDPDLDLDLHPDIDLDSNLHPEMDLNPDMDPDPELDLVNLEPGPGEPGKPGIWNLVNLEPGPGRPRIWNLGSLEPGTWASPPFQGMRTWDLGSGALSPEPAAWRGPGAWEKKSHWNRLQEVSWNLLPPGHQGGLQGEPKEVGEHIHLEWSPAWREGGQR